MKYNIIFLVLFVFALGCSSPNHNSKNVEIKKISIPGQNAEALTERATTEAMAICLKENKTIEIVSTEVIEADANEIDIDEELHGVDDVVVIDLSYKCI